MSKIKRTLEKQLTNTFLTALRSGSREPIDQFRDELKKEIQKYKKQPDTSLKEALSNPEPDMREAKEIIETAKDVEDTTLRTDPHQNPNYHSNLKTLETAHETAKNLNIDYRGYTIKENAKYIGEMSAVHAFSLAAIPFIFHAGNNFQNFSTDHYVAALLVGAFIGAVRGARINTSDYCKTSTTGLKFIKRSLKQS